MTCSIRDLRRKTKEIVDLAEGGEKVVVTFRGRPKAMVAPLAVRGKKSRTAFGLWAGRTDIKDTAEFVRELRKGRFE